MLSREMQIIVGFFAIALILVVAWVLWRRTARQSLTAFLFATGVILILGCGVPVVWWQVSERLKDTIAHPVEVSDHRISSQVTTKIGDYRRLETEIHVIAPKLENDRLTEIAHSYVKSMLDGRQLDLILVRLSDGESRPLLYVYAYKKSLEPEEIEPLLHPALTELAASVHVEEPRYDELGDYRTMSVLVNPSTKWTHLYDLLGSGKLPEAWQELDETLYDYLIVLDKKSPQFVLLFAFLDEEFLRQYQAAGGRPEELGLLAREIQMPSLLVLVQALQENVFRLSEMALVQTRGEYTRRYPVGELALREDVIQTLRPPWLRLEGSFPNFPNLLVQMRPGMRIIGLLRFPDELDPYQVFQVYYGDRWASFDRRT